MKLYASDNSDLMEVSEISREDNNLIIEGAIMGAMPIRAVLKPAEVRKIIGLLGFKNIFFALTMFFRGSR